MSMLTDRERIAGAAVEWLAYNRASSGVITPGDLVLLIGAPPDSLPIGFYVSEDKAGSHLIREVGRETTFTTSALPLRLAIPPEKLFEGAQHRAYEQVLSALRAIPMVEFATLRFDTEARTGSIRGTVYLRCPSRMVPWNKQVQAIPVPYLFGSRGTITQLRAALEAELANQLGPAPYDWRPRFVDMAQDGKPLTSTWRL